MRGIERSLQSLTSERYASLCTTSNNNVVDESGKWRDTTDPECKECTPVGAEFVVLVNTIEVVHVRHRHIAATNNKVIADQNASHWTQEDGVTTEESEELGSRCENLPWDETP